MKAFTLLELIVTIAVLSILLAVAVPSMQPLLSRNHLKAAAGALAEDLQWTRSEALKRNNDLYVTFDTSEWCYGIDEASGCDCTVSSPTGTDACALTTAGSEVLKVTSHSSFADTNLSAITFSGSPPSTGFEPRRGTATSAGSVTFQSSEGADLKVLLSIMGRVRICSPSDNVPGYPGC